MPIILDPDKSFVNFQVMFVEERNERHGNSKFHFIRSRADFDSWKKKGYLTSDEINQQSQMPAPEDKPGMPKRATPDPNKVIQILRTWWTRLNWKEQNQIYARCLRYSTSDGKTRTELDMISYRDLKLKTCLKRWDAKDENGKDIPLSDNVIDYLDPSVAQFLLEEFEKITEASEDEIKN